MGLSRGAAVGPEDFLDRQQIAFADVEGVVMVHDGGTAGQFDDQPLAFGLAAVAGHFLQ